MALTDRTVAVLKKSDKVQKIADGGGLYIVVTPTGKKTWHLIYRFKGKQTTRTLGTYPNLTLKQARLEREAAKELLLQGLDPSKELKSETTLKITSFESIARAWHSEFKSKWTEKNAQVILRRMERDIFPHIGAVPIKELKASAVLAAAKLIAARGALDYAHRALQYCGMVFRYAIAHDLAEHNIVADLKGALPTARVKHHATIIDPDKIGPLLRAIDNYDGMFTVKCALQLAPLVFVRPGELHAAAWGEFNFEKAYLERNSKATRNRVLSACKRFFNEITGYRPKAAIFFRNVEGFA